MLSDRPERSQQRGGIDKKKGFPLPNWCCVHANALTLSSRASASVTREPVCRSVRRSVRRTGQLALQGYSSLQTGSHDHTSSTRGKGLSLVEGLDGSPASARWSLWSEFACCGGISAHVNGWREVGLSGGKVHFLVRWSVCAFALGAD